MKAGVRLVVCGALIALAGCTTTQAVQPSSLPHEAVGAGITDTQSIDRVSEALETMSSQLFGLQDQLLGLKRQSLEQGQALQSLQVQNTALRGLLTAMAPDGKDQLLSAESPPAVGSFELEALMDQLAVMQTNSGELFNISSCYTPSGRWILIRYSVETGKAWLADNGQWAELIDLTPIEFANYRVVVEPARQDTKGYVAARVDRETGKTWWLKQDTWQEITE